MIAVISQAEEFENETQIINELFENGLQYFHLRKYNFTDQQMRNLLIEISDKFYKKIVLHSHFHLAQEFSISRLHINEANRNSLMYKSYRNNFILSTSTHHINDFNSLSEMWAYAFLSPIFQSISKQNYRINDTVYNQLEKRENYKTKLIALGGICGDNLNEIFDKNINGIALLGAVWQSKYPVNYFKGIKEFYTKLSDEN